MAFTFSDGSKYIKTIVCEHSSTTYHSHSYLELAYVIKGSAVHRENNEEMFVKQGDYFIIDYGSVHSYFDADDTDFTVINCLFSPELIDVSLKHCKSFNEVLNHPLIKYTYKSDSFSTTDRVFCDDSGEIFDLMQKLLSEGEENRSGRIEIMRCYLIEIIILTLRKLHAPSTLLGGLSGQIIGEIDENYMSSLTLCDIARKLNYSVPYLSNKFKKDVGMSFHDYLRKRRMEHACTLLGSSEKGISEIAVLVGYRDLKTFSSVFKQLAGHTPTEFKRMIGKD